MTNSALIRPAWTPATVALMVLGFMVFWPLGLAMIAYIMFGDRFDVFKRDINKAADSFTASFKPTRHAARTGNVAFDDWREAELDRLHEERRKLDEMREDFDTYMRELRRAKDQQEFNEFMAERKGPTKKKGKSVPTVSDA